MTITTNIMLLVIGIALIIIGSILFLKRPTRK